MATTDGDRIREIQRVLGCMKTDYIGILSLPIDFNAEHVKNQYRSLSILLHPDKAPPTFEERAKVAFSVLNAAKEAIDSPDKLKSYQQAMKIAEEQVQTDKIAFYTKLRNDELARLAASGSSVATTAAKITVPELKKFEQYRTWVGTRIKDTLVEDDWKKQLSMKREQELVKDEIREQEEAQLLEERKALLVAGKDLSAFGKTPAELEAEKITMEGRINNWQQYRAKKPTGRYTRARVGIALASASNPLVSLVPQQAQSSFHQSQPHSSFHQTQPQSSFHQTPPQIHQNIQNPSQNNPNPQNIHNPQSIQNPQNTQNANQNVPPPPPPPAIPAIPAIPHVPQMPPIPQMPPPPPPPPAIPPMPQAPAIPPAPSMPQPPKPPVIPPMPNVPPPPMPPMMPQASIMPAMAPPMPPPPPPLQQPGANYYP